VPEEAIKQEVLRIATEALAGRIALIDAAVALGPILPDLPGVSYDILHLVLHVSSEERPPGEHLDLWHPELLARLEGEFDHLARDLEPALRNALERLVFVLTADVDPGVPQ
jgi:hypothetical protein